MEEKFETLEIENKNGELQSVPRKKKSGFWLGMLIGSLASMLLVVSAGTVFLLYQYGKLNQSHQVEGEQSDTLVTLDPAENSIVDAGMQKKLQAIETLIDTLYYQEDIDATVLEEGVYRGIMDAIGDPYSTYYSAQEVEELLEQTQGIYYGIGAYVSLDTVTGLPKIASAIPGTPAEAADLRPDDIIYKVDGQEVYGMDLNAVTALIKGEEGTAVNLTIIREGESDYLSVDVVRRKVETPTIEYEMFEDGMGYIQILEFDEVTVDQFADALATLKGSDMKGLIIDVRANPGGSLDAVLSIARMLLPEGLILYTEDKAGNREEYTCDGTREFQLPLVVLIDGNSASAAEILAGSVQDYGIGTLVGTKTFGKGIVQQVISMSDGSAVKLTVSSYFTPNGRNIHGIGIQPDLECEFDGDAYYNEGYDNQLEYAKEVLAEKIKAQ